MRYIFLDTETTGLNHNQGDRLVEIGCLEMIERNLTNKNFHVYLNPERTMPIEAFNVHGLSTEFLADKPLFKHKAQEFIEFIQDATLIIHNASFDLGFLNMELKKIGLPSIESCVHNVIDSLKEARTRYPGKKNSLDALCDRLEVDRTVRDYHGALVDCKLLANVWLAMSRGQNELFVNYNILNTDFINHDNTEKPIITHIEVQDFGLVRYANEQEISMHEEIMNKIRK